MWKESNGEKEGWEDEQEGNLHGKIKRSEGNEGLLKSFKVEEMAGSSVQFRKIPMEGLCYGGARKGDREVS